MSGSVAWDENVSNFRFVAWDTETTGSSPSSDHLVEIAAVVFDEDFDHRRFESLVRPPTGIPPEVVKIHGISDVDVAGSARAPEVLERFFDFLKMSGHPRVLIAHNAGFDVGIVHGECRRADKVERGSIESVPEIVLDSCMLAKALLPELPQHRLEKLAQHFKIETGRMHRAAEDVRVLREVFLKLLGLAADQVPRGKGFTLSTLIDIAGGYFELDAAGATARTKPFRLPPRIAAIESLCGESARVGIAYETEEDYRYITPTAIKMRAFRVYVEAFCHRENINKTFRADKILRIGKVEEAGC